MIAGGLDRVLDALRTDERLGPQVAHVLHLPPSPSRFAEPERPLPAGLAAALVAQGIERLWSHQIEGLDAARRGEDVLVTTPTASGKSLVFQLPVAEAAERGEPGRALFLFPLKALGQDQRKKFSALVEAAGIDPEAARCEIYDGDTPRRERERIRSSPPRVVISNPDMLHLGILGSWGPWEEFLRDLRWIVLDELHTYRGIFGSHFHHVVGRLLRVCHHLGGEPRFVASSATAANPGEFAQALVGRPFHLVEESGAPREGRHFLVFRPEASAYTTALELLVHLVSSGLKTIVFTKARRITELLYSWLRRRHPERAGRVACYRSGFLPEERRNIEARLFRGELDGVISTSALEMGIDVGGLDACVLVGYPGSVMATWQRSGRVGRSGRESVTALVPLPDALDQYLLEHPQELVGRPLERLIVDPDNEPVTKAHLVCAAAELPLSREADRALLERHAPLVGELLREGELAESADDGRIHARRRRPQRGVGLRGSGATCTILDSESGRVVGTVDGVRALMECHPGAVYLHGGRQYLVRELDLEASKAHAEPASVSYFTTPLTEKDTEILEVLERREDGPLQAWLGKVRVTERVVGFERKRLRGQEVIDRQSLDLPPTRFETVALWWTAPEWLAESLAAHEEHFLGSLHASEHAVISLFPLVALCDRGDIGGISFPRHPQLRCGGVFVYDGHPGGVGIAARGFRELPELLGRVLALLEECPCEDGCPACTHSPKCGNGNRPLDKSGAARSLRLLLGREEPVAEVVAAGEPETAPPGAGLPDDEEAPAAPRRPALDAPPASPPSTDEPGSRDRVVVDPGEPMPWEPGAFRSYRRHARSPRPPAPEPSPRRTGASPAPRTEGRRLERVRRRTPVLDTVLFDLETIRSAEEVGGWERSYRMRVAVGVVLHLEEGRFEIFREEGVPELVRQLEAADLVVGFNSEEFDYQVLSGYTGIDYRRTLPTLDLLVEIEASLGFRLSLNHLVTETLGEEKTADGLQSLEWVQEGRWEEVEAYCRRDVELLRDLYLHGRRMGWVAWRDRDGRRLRLPVEW